MQVQHVERISLGNVNSYLILTDKGSILVDTGAPGSVEKLCKAFSRLGLDIGTLQLIILTHVHIDHIGGAAELQERSGAPLILHESAADIARSGFTRFPGGATGLGRAVASLTRRLGKTESSFKAFEPDILFADEYDVLPFGFPGKLFHTPGHCAASVCLVGEENGLCFTGDSLFGVWPRRLMPPFADTPELLPAAWRKLLEHGAQYFYPGHGRPFDRERLLKELWRAQRQAAVK